MLHRGEIERKGRCAEIFRGSYQRRLDSSADRRLQRGQNTLPIILSDNAEPQPHRHQIGGESLQVGEQRVR